jgi:hypothetical protein
MVGPTGLKTQCSPAWPTFRPGWDRADQFYVLAAGETYRVASRREVVEDAEFNYLLG